MIDKSSDGLYSPDKNLSAVIYHKYNWNANGIYRMVKWEKTFFSTFNNPFLQKVFIVYYVIDAVLGNGNITDNKTDKNSCPRGAG